MMRALVTGADGFVGHHLVAHLSTEGDRIVESSCDITNRDEIVGEFARADAEVVYHLAGQADVGGSWQNPAQTMRVNVEGTLNVLDAARLAGCRRVVVVTSADVYGRISEADLPIRETHDLRPVSPYAASKAAVEMVCIQAGLGHGLDVVRIRAFNHLGPGQSDRFVASAIASRIAACEREGSSVVKVGTLDARRDFTDVRDVVRAYRSLMADGQSGEVYNVCSGRDRSVRDVTDILVGLSTADITLETDPALVRPVDLSVLRGDNSKISNCTGWSPTIPIEQTLEDLLGFWRSKL
jgi:GDP-4-dehydro-6-deoxy-D-mannose reductase